MNFQTYLILSGTIIMMTIIVSVIVSYRKYSAYYRKSIEPDITLEQMQNSEENIARFLQENNLSQGASILNIAEVLQVSQGGEDNRLDVLAQLSEQDENGNRTVTFKTGLSAEEKIFNFAHECAHLVNRDTVPATRPEGHNKPPVEQIADYTAAALLMPLGEVYDFLEGNGYKKMSSRKRVGMLHNLCERYGVSEVIALRRIDEVYKLKQ